MQIFANSKSKIQQAYKALMADIEKTETNIVGVDTEGSSLDNHTLKLWSIQFGTPNVQVLIPTYTKKGLNADIGRFANLLANPDIEKVIHRASYDLKVLWTHGWDVNNVWCSRTAEQILKAGTLQNTALAGTLLRYFGVDMSKDERTDFYKDEDGKEADKNGTITVFEASGFEWTEERQNYALKDVQYLVPLAIKQRELLQKESLLQLAERLELPLVEVTGLLEYRGVRINKEKTQAFQKRMAKRAEEEKVELIGVLDIPYQQYARPIFQAAWSQYNEWYQEHRKLVLETNKDRDPDNKRKISAAAKQRREEHKAIAPFRSKPKEPTTINIGSTYQVRAALMNLDHPVMLPDMRKETLQNAIDEHPLIAKIIEQKKYAKLAEMGEIYEKINAVTSRIHTEYNQIVDTGRYSSKNPNLQNTPARSDEGSEFRALFEPEPGNILIGADFSAIELVIIGVLSKDANLLYALNNVEDLHCFSMSKALKCSYDSLLALKKYAESIKKNPKQDLPSKEHRLEVTKARQRFDAEFHFPELKAEKDLSKWVIGLRTNFKNMTYGWAYGISPFGLSKRFHSSVETAEQFLKLMFSVYPTTRKWLETQSNIGESKGFSITPAGRKRYYNVPYPPSNKDIEYAVTQYLKNHYSMDKDHRIPEIPEEELFNVWEQEKTRLKKEYKATINRIRRQAANAPIQGASADITKYSMLLFEIWWKQFCELHNIDRLRFGIVLTVHDELVVECPKEYAEEVLAALKHAMEKGARKFLGNTAKIVVEPKIMPHWQK